MEELEYPCFYLDFEEENMKEGMSALSFVDKPATQIKWEVFSEVKNVLYQKFEGINDEKRIVTSPVMLAETEILRYNENIGKYFVKFSSDTIEKMMKKYFKENRIHTVNLNHNPETKQDGIYMIESYLVGDRNKSELFSDIQEGSWVATFLVENDEVWDKIKDGTFQGFSLEGYFIEKYEDDMINKLEEKIKDVLNSDLTDTDKETKIKKLLNLA